MSLHAPADRASIPGLMNPAYADADILTSAYMAAGMTSRARRRAVHTAG
ncbi:hypothetical protein [Cognatilysobacter lacus]|nr:hypothetical protein [Lysobacter lacus]